MDCIVFSNRIMLCYSASDAHASSTINSCGQACLDVICFSYNGYHTFWDDRILVYRESRLCWKCCNYDGKNVAAKIEMVVYIFLCQSLEQKILCSAIDRCLGRRENWNESVGWFGCGWSFCMIFLLQT